jgi:hypothetical protein
MNRKGDQQESQAARDLRQLLDADPTEEDVHQFFAEHVLKIGHGNPRISDRFIAGAISKFAITPDRIPDFVSVLLNVRPSQRDSRVTFVELKKPNTPLYTSHSRMSKDLNDAWMECVESSRLMADNFRDCLRRIVKSLDQKRLAEFNSAYDASTEEGGKHTEVQIYDERMPRCHSVIVIGRRSTLDAEGLMRTRELSASTCSAIQVITYDTVLDWIAEGGDDAWSPFHSWFW